MVTPCESVGSARRFGSLALYADVDPARRLRLSGSRYDIGYQHGLAHRALIRRFLADRSARLMPIMTPGRFAVLSQTVQRYMRVIETALPGMAEELRGLASGAEIAPEDAYLLQLRRELAGYQSVRPRGDCTVFGRLTPGRAVLGQTIDLNGNMEPELTAIEIEHADGRRLLLASFTGLLGYLGMNDRGVAICLNLVLSGEWREGIPGYMAIRYLLDEASTVADCLDRLGRLRLASSRALTICDGGRLVTVEYILNEMVVFEGDELTHTNHFLHPMFAVRDELNPFARTSSLRRLEACTAALRRLPIDADTEAYFEFLHAPPIYVAPNGDIRRECTVGSALMRPDLGAMFVRQRGPTAQLAH